MNYKQVYGVKYLVRALQRQFRLYISFLGIARPQPQFPHSYVCERFIQYISSSRKGSPIVGIYNSLKVPWLWKSGLRPRYSFSGNICFKFSAFCLCSAVFTNFSLFNFLINVSFSCCSLIRILVFYWFSVVSQRICLFFGIY